MKSENKKPCPRKPLQATSSRAAYFDLLFFRPCNVRLSATAYNRRRGIGNTDELCFLDSVHILYEQAVIAHQISEELCANKVSIGLPFPVTRVDTYRFECFSEMPSMHVLEIRMT